MTEELELDYLGIIAKFHSIETRETYFSKKYGVIVAIFRNFNSPILIKSRFHNCWTHLLDDGDTCIDLSERYVHNYKTRADMMNEITNRKR